MDSIETLTKMFEYNLFANRTLLHICKALTEEQLEYETEGGFGSIQHTLAHLISSEWGYIRRLSAEEVWDGSLKLQDLSMAELIPLAEKTGQKFIDLIPYVDPGTPHAVDFPVPGPHQGKQFSFYNWTVLLQALHHGIEHRTHIKVLLTHLGIEHPDLSAWTYMEALQGFL